MCRMHRIFFFLMQQPQPLKSHSLETNLSEAIFRHFRHANSRTIRCSQCFKKGCMFAQTHLSTNQEAVLVH